MKNNIYIILITLLFFSSCDSENEDYIYYPKPISGQKIVFPQKEYINYESLCNYKFDIPVYSEIEIDSLIQSCNTNINFKTFNAKLYLTYVKVDTNLMYNIEYSRKLAYDHSIKADAIEEAVIKNSKNKTYGVQYKIIGNAASNYQFYVTDSTNNFLRGALYFNCPPNYDSLQPTLEFIIDDFDHMIKTISWK
jgi:gliding motility-associated lipoprotein GldD